MKRGIRLVLAMVLSALAGGITYCFTKDIGPIVAFSSGVVVLFYEIQTK